ncbi:hypothetical protein AVEN_140541-1 [Araneus ventricosus]|uniref:DDE-1 domain-containing protein n=1 Tax=Araneus ventricosus TaxID=182803 RepID=A0A4Y2L394_ARAVE|nr:hypothetical protein AVEN_140541-1 [Araneus ventricosus]
MKTHFVNSGTEIPNCEQIEPGESLTKLSKEFGVGISTVKDARRDSERIKVLCSVQWQISQIAEKSKEKPKEIKTQKSDFFMDNAPVHPDIETLKAENITCIFMPPNTTTILQPMDQGMIESIKGSYRKQLLSKLLFEGDDNEEEEAACSVVKFWKAVTLKDCVYMINEAW